ncbi:unnamed protein product [Parnassius mnemosyne]|uniref:Peptidase aspartic putative domain-containing protein n=1 Tax=Parnassius mnemosyne TaxID=213953 RepID=A0AAV1L5J5_9NEOP
MFHTPATPHKKRRPRGTAAKSECKNNQDVLPSFSLKDEVLEKPENAQNACSKSKKSSKTAGTSSSTARKRQLEYETAKAMALVEIQAAEAEAKDKVKSAQAVAAKIKANIQSKLLNKQLAAEMAELESRSRCSHKSAVKSSTSKVENSAPGNQHKENREDYSRETIGLEKLAHALNEAVAASSYKTQNQELLTRLATSKDLPLFFGDPMEWLQFKQAYQESTQLCKYSDTENLWRLRKCLRGDAKEAVTSLLIGGTTPELVIDTLELRFGKPETIMSIIVLQLKKLCPLPLTYHNDIINFAIKIKNYVAATKAMQQSDYLRSPELVSIVVSKLPTLLVAKWTDYVYEQRECNLPKLELLSDFLYEEATKTAASGVSHIHALYNLKKLDERKHRSHSLLLYTNSNQLQNAEKCIFCRKGAHGVSDCSRFKRALRKDRWRFVRVNKLCFKCLAPRHTNGMSCNSSNCDIDGCNQPHHRLLHWIKPLEESLKTVERGEDEHPSTNETVTHTVASQCHKVLLKVVPLTLHGPNGSLHTHALLDDGATVTVISSDIADELGLYGENVILRARSAWDSGELVCESQVLHDAVRRSFTLESIGVGSKPRRNPDEIRALQILDDTAELVHGQWTVGLPWKYDELHLPDSYPNAFNRLKSIERKFLLNKEYATRYCERMTYLFSNGYARELNETDENLNKRIIWYLPHFGVDNPNKKKLRLVYDAAAKSNGYSLNDFLLQGPDLLQSLLGIM